MRLTSVLLVALLSIVVFASRASAAGVYPPGGVGHDVSWPQCGGALPPAPYAFGVVGVTGGYAFTHNPCLRSQYTWATASGQPASVYINMKYPAGTTIGERDSGPAGNCGAADQRCQAYNYGYKTARDAFAYAKTQGVLSASTWWLDIETESTWSEDKAMNAVVIGAAIDFLKSEQVTIGIYSTRHQWSLIAGDFRPGLPNWVGGGSSLADARLLCATGAFGGGEVQLVQYPGAIGSNDYACRAEDMQPPPGTGALSGGAIPPDGGFGLAVFRGGTATQLVQATGCPATTAVFYFTAGGAFVLYVPGTAVTSVNEAFLATFPGGAVPANTAFLGKCA